MRVWCQRRSAHTRFRHVHVGTDDLTQRGTECGHANDQRSGSQTSDVRSSATTLCLLLLLHADDHHGPKRLSVHLPSVHQDLLTLHIELETRTAVDVRGSYSARVPRSSSATMHREFVHHIVEDEVDGQEEGQDDKREDGEQREESGAVEIVRTNT